MENDIIGLDHSNEIVENVNTDKFPKTTTATYVKEKLLKRKRKFKNVAKEDLNEEFDCEKDPNVQFEEILDTDSEKITVPKKEVDFGKSNLRKIPDEELCNICNKKFKNKNSLRTHIYNAHQEPKSNKNKILKCPKPKCYFEATNQESISEHLVSHNHFIKLKCPKPNCSFEAKNQTGLSCHLSQHNDCTYCELSFVGNNGKRNLQAHLRKHLKKHEKNQIPKEQHKCQICCKDFKFPSQLKKHMKKHEKVKVKKIVTTKCQICNKDFKFPSNLEYHLDSSRSCAIEKSKKALEDRLKIIDMDKIDHNYAKNYSNKPDSFAICNVFENNMVNLLENNTKQIQIDPFCDTNIKLEPFDEDLITEEILNVTPIISVNSYYKDIQIDPFTSVKSEPSVEETEFIHFVSVNTFDENEHNIKSEIKDEPP